jgi:hypothetical protein
MKRRKLFGEVADEKRVCVRAALVMGSCNGGEGVIFGGRYMPDVVRN